MSDTTIPKAAAQVRRIFDLLESGVKFSHHGGQYCTSNTGQRFYMKHLYMARAIRKLKTLARVKLKAEQLKAEMEDKCQDLPSV